MLQLHSSFASLGKDLRSTFDDLVRQLDAQQAEAERLRRELSNACAELVKSNEDARLRLRKDVEEEKQRGAEDRANAIVQMTAYMTALLQRSGSAQDARLDSRVECFEQGMISASSTCQQAQENYEKSMDSWMHSERAILAGVLKSRDGIKSKIKSDWTVSDTLAPNILIPMRAIADSN